MRTFRWIFSSFFNPMKSNQRFISNSSNRKVRIHCLFVFFRVPLSLCLSVLLHSCLWRLAIAKKRNEQQTLSHKPLVYTHILLLLFNNKRHCDDSSFIINKPSPFLFSFLRNFVPLVIGSFSWNWFSNHWCISVEQNQHIFGMDTIDQWKSRMRMSQHCVNSKRVFFP